MVEIRALQKEVQNSDAARALLATLEIRSRFIHATQHNLKIRASQVLDILINNQTMPFFINNM